MRPLRIAYIGQRGLPATYGGIERHVEEIGARLAERGHRVTVFSREGYAEQRCTSHRGMEVVTLPAARSKHAEAISHSAVCAARALGRARWDVVHLHALGPGLVSPLLRLGSTAKVVQTIHGLDNRRGKWGGAAQRILTVGEHLSAHVPHRTIVVAEHLREHYADVHGSLVDAIPNGVLRPTRVDRGVADAALDLGGRRFVLFVGRLVPEKAPDVLLRAFAQVDDPDLRLVLAGDSSHTDDYVAQLRRLAAADPRVVFAGYVYGDLLASLYSSAAAFVLPSYLEGLPLTLLEAASYGAPVVASDIPPHQEVIRAPGVGRELVATDVEAIAGALRAVLGASDAGAAGAAALRDDVLRRYDWDVVADRTEAVYRELVHPGWTRARRVVDVTDAALGDAASARDSQPLTAAR